MRDDEERKSEFGGKDDDFDDKSEISNASSFIDRVKFQNLLENDDDLDKELVILY